MQQDVHNYLIEKTSYENALAERISEIIKTVFNLYNSLLGFEQTGKLVSKSINAYNNLRPHASRDYKTPEETHLASGQLNKRWKDYNHNYNHEKTAVQHLQD